MMTEREKMLAGKLYSTGDPELKKRHERAIRLAYRYNKTDPSSEKKREKLIRQLFPNAGKELRIESGVQADYGENTYFGDRCFMNYNAVILDCAPIRIGNDFMAGPNVQIVTPVHPLVASERRVQEYPEGLCDREYAKPIEIGNDVWLASGVIVTGGSKIGDRCVIGAGSVVMGEIPAGYFAAGTPAKPIRLITDKDKVG